MARSPRWNVFLPPKWQNELDADTSKALTAELLGTLLFVFLATTGGKTALSIGISYTVASYAAAPISGGHINPIISIAFAFSGHMHAVLAGLFVLAQILGAIAANLLQAVLIPGLHIGLNRHTLAPGCLPHGLMAHSWISQLVWEFVLALFFLAVVYGVFAGHEKFASVAPLAAGLAIYALIETGGLFTGGITNPAVLIAPSIVFLCNWAHGRIWVYLVGQLLAAIAAAAIAVGHIGPGPEFSENRDELSGRTGGVSERLMPESDV